MRLVCHSVWEWLVDDSFKPDGVNLFEAVSFEVSFLIHLCFDRYCSVGDFLALLWGYNTYKQIS
jgi:hypothetical protein